MINKISEILKTFNVHLSVTQKTEGIVVGDFILLEVNRDFMNKKTFRIGLLNKKAQLAGHIQIDETKQVMNCKAEDLALSGVVIMTIGKFVHQHVKFMEKSEKESLAALAPDLRRKCDNMEKNVKSSKITH